MVAQYPSISGGDKIMRVSLAVEDKLFDLGHMNLIEVIRQLDDHDCNQPLLECLAHHPDPCIRIAVSGKQNLSPETVRFLLGVINNPQVQENIMNDHLTSSGMTYEALASLFEGDVDGLSGLARQIDQVRLSNDEVKSLITLLIGRSPFLNSKNDAGKKYPLA
jgi:hypothetical protein